MGEISARFIEKSVHYVKGLFHLNQEIFIQKVELFYGDKNLHFKWVTSGYQNFILKGVHHGKTVYIRISHSNRRPIEMIKAEFNWLIELKNAGVNVPFPVKSHFGNDYEKILIEGNFFYVVAFSEIVGLPVDVTMADIWNKSFFEKWGETLGLIHSTTPKKRLMRPNLLEPYTPVSETVRFFTNYENKIFRERLMEVIDQMKSLPRSKYTYGLIHNDFHQGNILVSKDRIGVIDFDDCVYGWFAQDLAVSLYHAYWQATAIGGENQSFLWLFLQHFLKGYQKTHPLMPEVVEQIPLFLKWRDLFLYSLFLKNWSEEKMEPWQTYTIQNLQKRIISQESFVPYCYSHVIKLIEENESVS